MIKKMNYKKSAIFEAIPEKTVEILDDMESKLKDLGVSESLCKKTRFQMEDPLVELIRNSTDDGRVKLTVWRKMKTASDKKILIHDRRNT